MRIIVIIIRVYVTIAHFSIYIYIKLLFIFEIKMFNPRKPLYNGNNYRAIVYTRVNSNVVVIEYMNETNAEINKVIGEKQSTGISNVIWSFSYSNISLNGKQMIQTFETG